MTAQASARPPALSVQQYRQELKAWQSKAAGLRAHPEQAAALEQQVPPEWQVQQDNRTLHVPSDWLQVAMARLVDAPAHRAAELTRLQQAIAAHLALLDDVGAAPSTTAARAQLRQVLARREFRGVHPPGAVQTARSHFLEWLTRFFTAAVDGATRHAGTMQWGIWIVLLLGLAASLRLIWDHLQKRRRASPAADLPPERPSATSWQRWVENARAAAGAGRFRDAVHDVYWAAISWLETQGAWMPDRARTPREYLRLVKPQPERSRALLALTRRFEPVWYGGRAASGDDFDAMLRELEELGCR